VVSRIKEVPPNVTVEIDQFSFPGLLEGVFRSTHVSSYSTPTDELLIPDVYGQGDAVSAVEWLQEQLTFSDDYLAELIGARQELFAQWKKGGQTLTSSQVRKLKKLSTAMTRLLSYLNFRRDLMMHVLEFQADDRAQIRRTRFTPPWLGASLKEYLLHHGGRGIDAVDSWVQSMRSANSL